MRAGAIKQLRPGVPSFTQNCQRPFAPHPVPPTRWSLDDDRPFCLRRVLRDRLAGNEAVYRSSDGGRGHVRGSLPRLVRTAAGNDSAGWPWADCGPLGLQGYDASD